MEHPRTATKRTLAALSFAIERIARHAEPGAVVLALFQRGPYFAPMAATYEALATNARVVIGFAGDGEGVPGASLVRLTDDELLAGVWSVVLLGSTVGAYVYARDLDQLADVAGPLESRRRFEATWGFDRAGAAAHARSVLEHLGARLDPDLAAAIAAVADRTDHEVLTTAERSLGAAALTLAARLDDTQRSLDAVQLELEEETQRATRDPLTGLVNREGMERWLGGAAVEGVPMPPLGVVMIDLDDFKVVNDTHGHEVGDEVLCAVADALVTSTRAGDIVTRWGGDEFLVLCPGLDGDELHHMAQRLVGSVSKASARGISVRASAGTQTTRRRPLPLDEADAALYSAKRSGRDHGSSGDGSTGRRR